MLDAILGYVFASQSIQDIAGLFAIAVNLLHSNKQYAIACFYLTFFANKFHRFTLRNEICDSFRSNIMAAMYACILALQNCVPSNDILLSETNLVVGHFQSIKNVDIEGLYIFAGLAIVFKRAFVIVLDQVWPYVIHGLTKVEFMRCRWNSQTLSRLR